MRVRSALGTPKCLADPNAFRSLLGAFPFGLSAEAVNSEKSTEVRPFDVFVCLSTCLFECLSLSLFLCVDIDVDIGVDIDDQLNKYPR